MLDFLSQFWYNKSIMKIPENTKKIVDFSVMSRRELEEYAMKKTTENEGLSVLLKYYEEQLRRNRAQRFGASSEKLHYDGAEQICFFNEAEQSGYGIIPEPKIEEVIAKPRSKKKKGHKKNLTKQLPHRQIEYKLTGDELICPKCGDTLEEMKSEVRTEIECVPASYIAVDYVQFFYACRNCDKNGTEGTIVSADAPKGVFRNSLASPSMLADIIYKKYVTSLPLYRQEKELAKSGVNITRITLSNWVINGSKTYLKPIYEHMHTLLLAGSIVHADETPVEVLREPGRAATTDSYMWVYLTGSDNPNRTVLFEYTQGRGQVFPKKFLFGYSGYLQTDGYAGYHALAAADTGPPRVIIVGCWQHARRKFTDVIKGLAKNTSISGTVCDTALKYINMLFMRERTCKDMSPEDRYKYRQENELPVIDAYFIWLKEIQTSCGGNLEVAVNYSINQEVYLRNYLLDGNLEISNNRAENSVRPFAVGRRNWLFCNTPNGAEASAIAYSIVETARLNGLDVFKYLEYIFATFKDSDIAELSMDDYMPWSDKLPENLQMPMHNESAA
jgi:transposase